MAAKEHRTEARRLGRFIQTNALAFVLLFSTVGCVAPKLPPADFSAPGWTVQEVPAIWRPSAKAEELTGELLWAHRVDDGSLYVQFSKGGLPIIIARQTSAGWTLSSSLRKGGFGGRGTPPKMLPWFQLATLPPTHGSGPWRAATQPDGHWTLTHSRTGEQLEGVAP
jgi:hypothetical protein